MKNTDTGTLLYWIAQAYRTLERESWEEGLSDAECADGLLDVLANHGLDPHRDAGAFAAVLRQERTTEYVTIKVPADCIPAGAQLVEAYETEREVVICGEPPEEPEYATHAELEAFYNSHNCDAMGCGSLSHVLYRFAKPKD